MQPSPTSDADVFSTVGGVISAIGNVVFPEFGWLLDVGCEKSTSKDLFQVIHSQMMIDLGNFE